jgi:hypothetical protein
MEINDINKVVFEYLIKMIKDDESIDIYDITEDQYDDIVSYYLNNFGTGYDITTEYFGNQSIFEPSTSSLLHMIKFVMECEQEFGSEDFTRMIDLVRSECEVLKHYACGYIMNMGHEQFLVELKKYV